jgi:hypothetical protein
VPRHYFFLAATVFPRRPLHICQTIVLPKAATERSSIRGGDSRRLGVLTTDTETPVVAETAVRPDLLEALEVVTHPLVDHVGENVGALAVGDVALTVKEPVGDLELRGVLHDGDDSLKLVRVELAGTGFGQHEQKPE